MADLARHVLRLLAADEAEPDAALLARFAANRDEAAFAALVRRHGPMVLGVCRRVLRHRQDAEDAFQATFLVLARRASAVRRGSVVGSWLYGVAYRTALAARRSDAARRAREERAGAVRDNVTTSPDDGPPPDLLDALDRELAALPDVYRAAVVACDLEGLTHREAAARLGWPDGTLSSRLARARALLARRLARFGLAANGAGLGALAAPEAVAVEVADATTRFGALSLAGEAVVAAPVAALVEGTMKAMLVAKLKGLAVAGVTGTALPVTTAAGWRAETVADDRGKAADPPAGKKADAPRNPDKDRVTALERERDALRAELEDLKVRLHRSEADHKKALYAAQVRAAEATAVRDRAAKERDAAKAAPPTPENLDPERADLRRELTDVKARLAEMEKQQKVVVDELKNIARAAVEARDRSRVGRAPAGRLDNDLGLAPPAPLVEVSPSPAPMPPATPPITPAVPRPSVSQTTPPPTTVVPVPDPLPPLTAPSASAGIPPSPVPPPAAADPQLEPGLPPPPVADPTPSRPAARPVVRVYPVAELAADEKQGEALAKVVRATVDPRSWAGDAGVEYLPGPKLLVVRQTKAGQEEVEELLKVLKVHAAEKRK